MIRSRIALIVSMSLLAGDGCRGERTPVPPPSAGVTVSTPAWVAGPDGIGNARVGSTVAELNAALGEKLAAGEGCSQLKPAGLPPGVSLMVESDTVVRVDVDTTGVPTAEGAGVGDTEDRIKTIYAGRVSVTPHKYTDGHYLLVSMPADTLRLIIFETDGHKVLSYRAGRKPQVEYVEGCA